MYFIRLLIRNFRSLLMLPLMFLANQSCTNQAFVVLEDYGQGINYSQVGNTFLIEGTYREFIVDHEDGKTASTISVVQGSSNRCYSFPKDIKNQQKLGIIQIGDQVQLEVSGTRNYMNSF
ncbi:MAG: hypothetical protein IPK04_17660 [Bdellovibrionales bacterium]|nr:hypothetical protein [Bdellovibrionales bacterium]